MKKITLLLFVVLSVFLILPVYCHAGLVVIAGEDFISGHVFYLATHKGIGDLVVKLTPTREYRMIGTEEKILITDKNGKFKFTRLPKGIYLLELYEGPSLLYRDMVDMMNKAKNKTIILKGEGRKFEPDIRLEVVPPEFR